MSRRPANLNKIDRVIAARVHHARQRTQLTSYQDKTHHEGAAQAATEQPRRAARSDPLPMMQPAGC